MKSNYKKLACFIKQLNNRNNDLLITKPMGININKYFMPSVANVTGTDLSKYKLVCKDEFSFNPMHVGRDKIVPIALSFFDEAIIVSPAYIVFKIIDTKILDPEYLMMWFKRANFDRNAWFLTDSSVRGGFSWEDFCNMELPVPSIEKQREIVREYNIIQDNIKNNESIIKNLEATAQAIYKEWFVDFNFPDEQGKPYKANGGAMVYDSVLEKEIPEGWKVETLGDIAQIKGGKRLPAENSLLKEKTLYPYIKVADMGLFKYTILNKKFEYLHQDTYISISKYTVNTEDLIISIVGSIGIVKIVDYSLNGANLTENCVKITNIKKVNSHYLYYLLNSTHGQSDIEMRTVGGVQGKLPIYNIHSINIVCPNREYFDKFQSIINVITSQEQKKIHIRNLLLEVQELLLSKMSA